MLQSYAFLAGYLNKEAYERTDGTFTNEEGSEVPVYQGMTPAATAEEDAKAAAQIKAEAAKNRNPMVNMSNKQKEEYVKKPLTPEEIRKAQMQRTLDLNK